MLSVNYRSSTSHNLSTLLNFPLVSQFLYNSVVSRKRPRMSNPKMSNPRMSNPKMSNAKMSKGVLIRTVP